MMLMMMRVQHSQMLGHMFFGMSGTVEWGPIETGVVTPEAQFGSPTSKGQWTQVGHTTPTYQGPKGPMTYIYK